jgi:hypothetical protein
MAMHVVGRQHVARAWLIAALAACGGPASDGELHGESPATRDVIVVLPIAKDKAVFGTSCAEACESVGRAARCSFVDLDPGLEQQLGRQYVGAVWCSFHGAP